jgi:hypothetical protein
MEIQTVTRFFMWCTIINGAMLVFSSIMLLLAQDFVYSMHSKWFHIPRETFNVAIYSFLGFFKIVFIVFNLVPYLALLIVG